MDGVIDSLSLISSEAKIARLNFQNNILQFENYKKSLLPSFSLNANPVNFNRSLRLLQQPNDGNYSYVEDYSNNSSFGISARQKVGLTGGEFNISSNLNYLNEFSSKRNSFNTTPIAIGYSQQLWGGGRMYRLEKDVEYAKHQVAIKQYCSNMSQIQQKALSLFMTTLLSKLESELALQTKHSNDTLLCIAKVKLSNGNITEYDLKQIELQSLNTQYTYENSTKNYLEAKQKLFIFLGIDNDDAGIVVPYFNTPFVIDILTVRAYVEKNNPFFIQQEIQKLEAEKNIYFTRLNNRFNGNISLNYGINQYAETFADAYRQGNIRQSVTIGFQIPVFQWGINKNRIRIAENDYKASRLAADNKVLEFENEIMERVNSYNYSVKLWLTAEKAYKLSQNQYWMLVQKFAMGKVSVYELTSAQNDQNNAMQRFYTAIRDVYNSYFTLRNMALYDFKREKELEYVFTEKK
nr:TolC family protein [uncultured Bacteroides sp.]